MANVQRFYTHAATFLTPESGDKDTYVRTEDYRKLEDENAALREKVELKDELLQRIADWCVAYPLEVFPKPDVKASVKALHDAGLSYDAISANAMRHVVEGIAKIISPPEEQNHE